VPCFGLTPTITPSTDPLGLKALYWSLILYPTINQQAALKGSYGTITALKLMPIEA